MVILDGVGDLPHAALEGQTPLQAAYKPVLDTLVTRGRCGLVDPLAPGVVVETHEGTAPLLGVDREHLQQLKRGPIEAAGAGVVLAAGDVALRGNFATIQPGEAEPQGERVNEAQAAGPAILDRRAGRIREGTAQLAAALNELPPQGGVQVRIHPQRQHRVVVHMTGPGLSPEISDTDPGTWDADPRIMWARGLDGSEAAGRTAGALNHYLQRAQSCLAAHPINAARAARGAAVANAILTRGAGSGEPLVGAVSRRGLRGAIVVGDRAVQGLAHLLGIQVVTAPGFTGLVDSDPQPKLAAALEALDVCDIVWLHYKGTDIASHDRQPLRKRACIERMDRALRPVLDLPHVMVVTADHSTDCNTGSHAADPVPSLLWVPEGPADDVMAFHELACREGALGRTRSAAFLEHVLEAAGWPSGSRDQVSAS